VNWYCIQIEWTAYAGRKLGEHIISGPYSRKEHAQSDVKMWSWNLPSNKERNVVYTYGAEQR
jgi:hypothetical protein